jgi:predicted Zn-dependent peptidase
MLKPIVLKNGLTVLRIPRAGVNTFLTGFVVQTGSAVEEGYFPQGISRFIERLFWCGTDSHPSTRKLNLVLEQMGGNFTSMTSLEFMQFYLSVPSYNQYKAVSMLAEIIQTSYFDEADIKKEQRVLLENLSDFSEETDLDPSTLITSNLYQNSSLGLPIQGSVDSITSISQADILEYISHQIRPDKSYLVLAGNFENKKILDLIDKEWGMWKPKNKPNIQPLEFALEDAGELPRLVFRQRGMLYTTLAIGFLLDEGTRPNALIEYEKEVLRNQENSKKLPDLNIVDLTDQTLEKYAILMLLNSVLGQGLSSRLWVKCVEEELFFNQIQSEIVKFTTTGYLQIHGDVENTQFSFGLQSVLSVLEILKKTTISINELQKAKEYLKGKMIMEHENLLDSTVWHVESLVSSGLNFELEDLLNKINEINVNQIRQMANEIFVPQRLAISTLGTAKESRLIYRLINKYLA